MSTERVLTANPPVGRTVGAPVGRARKVGMRLGTVGQMLQMSRRTSRWWLAPLFLLLGVLGLALAGLHAIPYIAPFIYAVF